MSWLRRIFGTQETDPIDTEVVLAVVRRDVALAADLPPDAIDRLVQITTELVVDKTWEPVGDVEMTDDLVLVIAANAAVPILEFGSGAYRNVRSILLHSGTRRSDAVRGGPSAGVVTDAPVVTVGQASPESGPVSISADTALADSRNPGTGRNVVIHEFAHKLDMLDGYTDGTPPMAADDLAEWDVMLRREFEQTDPAGDHVLRDYAWSNRAEFFAVASEAFFAIPARLRHSKPDLYDALAGFYRQDPASR